jgi:hypothetical protein
LRVKSAPELFFSELRTEARAVEEIL